MSETEEIQRNLTDAERKLDAMKDNVSGTGFIKRLDREAPYHPLLLVWRMSAAVAVALGIGTLATLVTPILSADLARTIARFDVVPMVPLPGVLAILGLVCMVVGLSVRQLAIMRAQVSPMMTQELKQHQRLASDVQQAKASHEIRQRKKDRDR